MAIQELRCGLFIFRGQPAMHKGHIAAVADMLARYGQAILVLGSTNVYDSDNPIDAATRQKILEQVCEREGWGKRIVAILELADSHDEGWGRGVVALLAEIGLKPSQVIARGNNEWTKRALAGVGIESYVGEEEKREAWQGSAIRQAMRRGDKSYLEAYPEYLHGIVQGLVARVVEAGEGTSYCKLRI